MASRDQTAAETELVDHKTSRKKTKSPEAEALRMLARKGSIVTGTHVPYLNQFLGMLYKVRWEYLALALTAIFLAVSFVFGAIFKGLGCNHDDNYVDVSFLTLLQLFGGNGMDAYVSDDRSCVIVACVVSAMATIIQALIFSVVTARFMNPTIKLTITDHLVCKPRNGQQVLQFRVATRSGHVITDFVVQLLWLRPETTQEGESFSKPVPLPLSGVMPVLSNPSNCSHYIDESSPLWGISDLRTCPGSIMVLVGGTDSILRTDFDQVHMFSFRDIEYGRSFKSCMPTSISAAMKAGKRTRWDLSDFDATEPI